MARYRKKPVVVEAVRWTGENYSEVRTFVAGQSGSPIEDSDGKLHIWNTQEHQYILCPVGHWVIKGVEGEFYLCSPVVFAATYLETEESMKGLKKFAVCGDGGP